jgi:hypothetical protein
MNQTVTPSLDQFDDRMLADIGLNRDGTPVSENNVRCLPVRRRGLADFLDWLAAAMVRSPRNV